jgi:cysteine-rich repeat protein
MDRAEPGAGAANGTDDQVWFSTNATLDGGDTFLGSFSHGSVASGGSYNESRGVNVPNVAAGTYYMIVNVDAANSVPESTESNNVISASFTLQTCGNGSVNPGEQCEDGNTANGDCCSSTCQLEGNGSPCTADSNVCTNDVCSGATCTHPNNSAACDDGAFCNGTDTCGGGTCSIHTGDPCPGADGDGDCTESCDENSDTCTAADVNGSSCDDAVFCNGADTCNAGTCVHAGDPCAGGPACSNNCQEAGQTCIDPDGTACDDGSECTVDDQCTGGVCGGNSMICGDGTLQSNCNEDCDDGGFVNDDGCSDTCQFEPCKPTPDLTCKQPFVHEKASIKIKNDPDDNAKDSVLWKWSNGSHTEGYEFGDPHAVDDYWLCIYENDALVSTTRVPSGASVHFCDGKPCWSSKPKGYQYKSKTPGDDGATGVTLGAGDDGKAKAQFKGKGANLQLPDLTSVASPLVVQLVKSTGGACWSATYSAPFSKNDGVSLSDRAD